MNQVFLTKKLISCRTEKKRKWCYFSYCKQINRKYEIQSLICASLMIKHFSTFAVIMHGPSTTYGFY